MIGNDIIDLELAKRQSNWKRSGFLEKLFMDDEQLMISDAQNPEVMVWQLWSRKEAAYKAYQRKTGIRGFIPKQLQCNHPETMGNAIMGKVTIQNREYFTKTIGNNDYIHTIAVANIEDFRNIRPIKSNLISKDGHGIPFHTQHNNPVSISHHGRFEEKIQLEMNVEP